MNEIVEAVLVVGLLFVLGIIIINLFKIIIDMRRPRYLKPLRFFRMTNDSDLLEYTAENGVNVTVFYAESFFADVNESEETYESC
jgi:hypothetical protein